VLHLLVALHPVLHLLVALHPMLLPLYPVLLVKLLALDPLLHTVSLLVELHVRLRIFLPSALE
jgi:hypothetical protein